MKTLTVATLLIALAGLIYTFLDEKPQPELSRFDCADLTLFASRGAKSADDHCASYGGVALASSAPTARSALVILVRNQPVGGATGLAESSIQ